MRLLLSTIGLLGSAIAIQAADVNESLSISIAKFSEKQEPLVLFHSSMLEKKKDHAVVVIPFCVAICNNGLSRIKIFNDDNSFGYSSLSFEAWVGNQHYIISKKKKIWDRNILSWTLLEPNSILLMPFELNSHIWSNISIFNKNEKIRIRAVFTQKKLPDSVLKAENSIYGRQLKFYEGCVKSPWYIIKMHGLHATVSFPKQLGADPNARSAPNPTTPIQPPPLRKNASDKK